MPDKKQSDCVLCGTLAQFEQHDGGQKRYYKCNLCHYYAISERAVRHLQKHSERKSDLAKAAAGMLHETEILEITYDSKVKNLKLAKVSRSKYC